MVSGQSPAPPPPPPLTSSYSQLLLDAVFTEDVDALERLLSQIELGEQRPHALDELAPWAGERLAPLHLAARLASARAIGALLAGGASPLAADGRGWGCLHHLCASQALPEAKAHALRQLVRAGADVDARTASRQVPLHLAAHNCGDLALLSELMLSARESGARDAAGRTALHYVALAGLDLPAAAAAHRAAPPQPPPDPPPAATLARAAALVLRYCALDARDADAEGLTAAALAAIVGHADLADALRRAERAAARWRLARARFLPACMCLAFALAHASAVLFSLPAVDGAWAAALLAAAFGVLALSGGRCALAEPSYLPRRSAAAAAAAPPREASQASWCFACGLSRPMRAKHCRKCGRCVRGFDHHCPWINNCVGEGNRASFYVFVAAVVADVALLCSLALYAATRAAPGDDYGGAWVCGAWPPLCAPARASSAAVAAAMRWSLFGVALVALPPLSLFLANRTRNVVANITTNERINMKRYAHFKRYDGSFINPFDRGPLRNCQQYWGCCDAAAGGRLRVQYSRELVEEGEAADV